MGLIQEEVPCDLPSLPAAMKARVAKWFDEKQVNIKSTCPELPWQTVLGLKQVIAFMTSSSSLPVGEIAIIGSTVFVLVQEHILASLHSYGFLYGDELCEQEIVCGDVDIRMWILGEPYKAELKRCLKGLARHLSTTLPKELTVKKSAEILQRLYPEKYKDEIPENQIGNAIIGNTAFLKLHVQEDAEQFFMAMTLGDGEQPPLEVITAHKLKNASHFLKDSLRIALNSPSQGIHLIGGTQAAVDYKMKRVRIAHIEKCDARAYFRYFIDQLKGNLIDEERGVEAVLFKQLNESEAAKLLVQSAKNHLPRNDLSVLLLMVGSLACAEREGAAWDFEKIASSVRELAKLSNQHLKGEGKALYEAIYEKKTPFKKIFAALQVAAFFHLYTKPPFKACLTESSFAPAMQWQFPGGLFLVVPLEIKEALSLIGNDTLYEAFLPKTICLNKEERQVYPYLDCLELPGLFDLSEALAASHPRLAFYCLLADPILYLPKVLDLFQRCKEISQFEEYLTHHKLFPVWNLEEVQNDEEWLLALGGSGVLEIARIAYAKWKENPSIPLGIKLFDAFLKLDIGLALSIRKHLSAKEGFANEMAWRTFFDACRIAEDRDPHGFHRQELVSQALPLIPLLEKGNKPNKTLLTLLSWDQGEGSPLYFALLENGLNIPQEYSPICQRELINAYNKKNFDRVAHIHALAQANKIEVKAPQDCLLLEQMIEKEVSKNNFKSAFSHIVELAKLQKLSDKTLTSLEKIVVSRKTDIYALLDNNLQIEAFPIWKKHFMKDIAMAESIYLALPYGEVDALIDLGLAILSGSKKAAPDDLCVLLTGEHPKKVTLLLAMLGSSCAISDKPGLKKAVHEESTKRILEGKIDEAVELWAEAKKKQIAVSDYFQGLPSPKSLFFHKLLKRKLLTAAEATEGINTLVEAGETEDIAAIVTDLTTIKEYPHKLTPLLEKGSVGLAKAILSLPCTLPKSLPLARLIEKADETAGLELFDLAEKKGIKIFNKIILRLKAESAIEAKNGSVALPILLQLMELDLLEKAAKAGLLDHVEDLPPLLTFSFENPASFHLKFTLLKQAKTLEVREKDFLKAECQRHVSEEQFAVAKELLLLMQSLGLPIQIQNEKLSRFVHLYPEFGKILAPCLPFADAFPFLPAQERYDHLMTTANPSYALQTAKDLAAEPEKALRILEKFEVQEPSLWIETISKLSETDAVRCWGLLQEKTRFLGEEVDPLREVVLLNLAKTKNQIILDILTHAIKLPENRLIKIIPELFLGCPDQEELLQARILWQHLLIKVNPTTLLSIDLKLHNWLFSFPSTPLNAEAAALEAFCQLTKAQIFPVKAELGKALTTFLQKCKRAPHQALDVISGPIFEIIAAQKNLKLPDVDPFLILILIIRLQEESFFELAPHFLLCGLESLKGKDLEETQKHCELIFFNLVLNCDDKVKLEQNFKVLDHKMCPHLFPARALYEQVMLEMICKGFEILNEKSEYTLDFISEIVGRFRICANLVVTQKSCFDRILIESGRAIVNLLLKKLDKYAKFVDFAIRTHLCEAYKFHRTPEATMNETMIKRSIDLAKSLVEHLPTADKEALEPILAMIYDHVGKAPMGLFALLPEDMEEITTQFLRASVKLGKQEWILKAKTLLNHHYKKFKNKQYASEIENILKKV